MFLLLFIVALGTAFCQEPDAADAFIVQGIHELPPPARALTPDETCEFCQLTLRSVYGHFGGKVVSRRKLSHQLKHQCNRHSTYRRRCLLFVKDNNEMIFSEMSGGDFKPIKPCFVLKECKRLQSPIIADFSIASAAVVESFEASVIITNEQSTVTALNDGAPDEKSDPDAGEYEAQATASPDSDENEDGTTKGFDVSDGS